MALGVMDDLAFVERKLALAPGERLLFIPMALLRPSMKRAKNLALMALNALAVNGPPA